MYFVIFGLNFFPTFRDTTSFYYLIFYLFIILKFIHLSIYIAPIYIYKEMFVYMFFTIILAKPVGRFLWNLAWQ